MHRLTPALVLLLAACGGQSAGTLRPAEAPIWSAAAFAPAAIAGDWQQVADLAATPGGCDRGSLHITPQDAGLALDGTLCLNGQARAVRGLARVVGPGRLALAGQDDWWILWVDSGYRTLAIGTPSGQFGFVLDRGDIPADRLQAAKEVLDFNGYSTDLLRAF